MRALCFLWVNHLLTSLASEITDLLWATGFDTAVLYGSYFAANLSPEFGRNPVWVGFWAASSWIPQPGRKSW